MSSCFMNKKYSHNSNFCLLSFLSCHQRLLAVQQTKASMQRKLNELQLAHRTSDTKRKVYNAYYYSFELFLTHFGNEFFFSLPSQCMFPYYLIIQTYERKTFLQNTQHLFHFQAIEKSHEFLTTLEALQDQAAKLSATPVRNFM